MPAHCCVPLCKQRGTKDENGKKVSFHRFPRQKELYKKWVIAIKRDEGKHFKITKSTVICSKHFRECDFLPNIVSGLRILRDEAVPSLFAFKTAVQARKPPKVRTSVSGKAVHYKRNERPQQLLSNIPVSDHAPDATSVMEPVSEDSPLKTLSASASVLIKEEPQDTSFSPLTHGMEEITTETTMAGSGSICVKTEPYDVSCSALPGGHHENDEVITADSQEMLTTSASILIKEEPQDASFSPLTHGMEEITTETTMADRGSICVKTEPSNISCSALPGGSHENDEEVITTDSEETLSASPSTSIDEEPQDASFSPLTQGMEEITTETTMAGSDSICVKTEPYNISCAALPGDRRENNDKVITANSQGKVVARCVLQTKEQPQHSCSNLNSSGSSSTVQFTDGSLGHDTSNSDLSEVGSEPDKTAFLREHGQVREGHSTDSSPEITKQERKEKYCTSTFVQSEQLGQTGKNVYKCELCPATLSTSGNLKRHMQAHAREKPFKCKHCGAEFFKSGDLIRHLHTHTEQKTYKCEPCPAEFTDSSHLKCHVQIHTGVKPYMCALCPPAFTVPKDLEHHIETHSEEKSFRCEHCGAGFTKSAHLKRHLQTRTGEKADEFELCPTASSKALNVMGEHTGDGNTIEQISFSLHI